MILLISCTQQEEIEVDFREIKLPTTYDIREIHHLGNDHYLAVGGRQFKSGFVAESVDDWFTHDFQEYGGDVIYSVDCFDYPNCLATGFISKVIKGVGTNLWEEGFLPISTRLASCTSLGEMGYITVGGHSLGYGLIYRLDSLGNVSSVQDSLLHELHDVLVAAEGTVHVSGYGIVMRSSNLGADWEISDLQGDFFLSMDFVDDTHGYVVGEFGTIAKTQDGGKSWEKLRNGNSIFVSDLQFQDIHFVTEDHGYIAGRDGLIWKTTDGGKSWESIVNVPDVDYYCIESNDDELLIGGSNGVIVRIPYH